MVERFTLNGTRFAVLFLLGSAVFPSLSRAQGVPVFEVNHADSTMKFNVKASVAIRALLTSGTRA
jgi:hypothetical protein